MFLTATIIMLAAADPTQPPSTDVGRPDSVKTHPATWITVGDYPISARSEKREGAVEFKVRYDANGIPNRCEILVSSGHADLDETTCRLVQARARFAPGRNAQGESVGGTYQNKVNWRVP